jgi:UPF0755 protein
MDDNLEKTPKIEIEPKLNFRKLKLPIFLFTILLFLGLGYFLFFSAPTKFIPGTILQVEPGMSLRSISKKLKEQNIIRSRSAFEAFAIFFGGEKKIRYSDYIFETKMPVYKVALLVVRGERYVAPVVVTIPEGFNLVEIAEIYAKKLVNFNRENFLLKGEEGYLFPDTYYFIRTDTEAEVIDYMSKNYEKKISSIRDKIVLSGKTEKDIIIMASILEKEAKGDNDRELISGILWKRLSINMPLQVDAEPNTYKVKGLPKNPIGNPGLEAINAAIYPKSSPYLYYLHDKKGTTHYAKNFEEHKKNIAKYLK